MNETTKCEQETCSNTAVVLVHWPTKKLQLCSRCRDRAEGIAHAMGLALAVDQLPTAPSASNVPAAEKLELTRDEEACVRTLRKKGLARGWEAALLAQLDAEREEHARTLNTMRDLWEYGGFVADENWAVARAERLLGEAGAL